MTKDWKATGKFDDVVSKYASIDSSVEGSTLERRKYLLSNLRGALLVPEQEDLLNYAERNVEDMLFFESGGTFGFFVNNFLDIVYADAVSYELRERGQDSVNFFIIDPTDVSRFERTLIFGGKKIKMPLPTSPSQGRSTSTIGSPQSQDIQSFIDRLERITELYIEDTWRVNHGFKREDDLREDFKMVRGRLRDNLERLKKRSYEIAEESEDYREFTDKFLIELINPLAKNSLFVTLRQWQSAWDIADRFKDREIYDQVDRINEELEESGRIRREDGRYNFPFRIDTGEWVFPSPIVDLEEGMVYMNERELKMGEDGIKESIDDLFTPDFGLIPSGGLLYTLDSFCYGAVSLAPLETRVRAGHMLAEEMGRNPKPILSQEEIPFYSVGRKTTSSPKTKVSGAVAAYLEGIGSEFVLGKFRERDGQKFYVESPIFSTHGQPEV